MERTSTHDTQNRCPHPMRNESPSTVRSKQIAHSNDAPALASAGAHVALPDGRLRPMWRDAHFDAAPWMLRHSDGCPPGAPRDSPCISIAPNLLVRTLHCAAINAACVCVRVCVEVEVAPSAHAAIFRQSQLKVLGRTRFSRIVLEKYRLCPRQPTSTKTSYTTPAAVAAAEDWTHSQPQRAWW